MQRTERPPRTRPTSRAALAVAAAALACLLLSLQHDARADVTEEAADPGAEIYRRACQSCHGDDGRGAPVSQVGFEVGLPDFSDCNFALREPDTDWMSVVHHGGPARAFDETMPAFGAALSRQEQKQVLDHLRRFCKESGWPRGELNLPRAFLTEKAYPEDEAVIEIDVAAEGPVEVSGKLVFETRFASSSQFEVIVPWGVRERTADEQALVEGDDIAEGLGDIAIGTKHALVHSLASGTIFAFGGELFFPTGDEADGFGKGTFAFEPFLSYGQIVPLLGFLQLQGGAEIPFDFDRADPEAFGRVAFGRTFRQGRFGRTWTPMVEIQGKGELGDAAKLEWTAVPQLQIALSKRQHVLMNVGFMLPLDDLDARHAKVLTYLLWDWFDGGFFEGW